MNIYTSYQGRDKACELPKSKSKTGGWTINDLMSTLAAIAVATALAIHSQNQYKKSQATISTEQNSNASEVAHGKFLQIEEYQRKAHDAFLDGFSEAVDNHRQQMLDACLASSFAPLINDKSTGSGLTATSSKVHSVNITWPDDSTPTNATEAFSQISRYTTAFTIFWKGPDGIDGYCDFKLVSNGTGRSPAILLLKMQKLATSR